MRYQDFFEINILKTNTDTFFRPNILETDTETFWRLIIFGTDTETFFETDTDTLKKMKKSLHPVARRSPMLGEDHFARSWVWAGYI